MPTDTSPSVTEAEKLVVLLRQPDRWDCHFYEDGFATTRGSPIPSRAADEIERLRAQLDEARGALENIAEPIPPEFVSDGSFNGGRVNRTYKAGRFDRARELALQTLTRISGRG